MKHTFIATHLELLSLTPDVAAVEYIYTKLKGTQPRAIDIIIHYAQYYRDKSIRHEYEIEELGKRLDMYED